MRVEGVGGWEGEVGGDWAVLLRLKDGKKNKVNQVLTSTNLRDPMPRFWVDAAQAL
jgi:hypothetical protein